MTTRRRNGLTLTELLVVGTIILAVTALSIPVVKPMMESQLTKNGANMLATALNRARSRAMVTGRPCGVRFEYWPGTRNDLIWDENNEEWLLVPESEKTGEGSDDRLYWKGTLTVDNLIKHYLTPGASLVMRQVEVPPIYSGLLGIETVKYEGGRCHFQNDVYIEEELSKTDSGKIQFGGSGPFYSFQKSDEGFKLIDGGTYALPPERETEYPFKILLDCRTTMAMPVCMPRGTAVDLQFSGIGDSVFIDPVETDTYEPPVNYPMSLTIMFAPDGSVESVNGTPRTESIHFLVGRWDQISAVRDEEDSESYPNYADGRNYWVSVFPQTGGVTVSQVNPTADLGYFPNPEEPSSRRFDYNGGKPDCHLDGVIGLSRELTR